MTEVPMDWFLYDRDLYHERVNQYRGTFMTLFIIPTTKSPLAMKLHYKC